MMHALSPWKSYRQVATLTAPPAQIVLMLYDGALTALNRALPGFSKEDPAQANMTIHNNLQQAQEIIRQLNYALNMELGGDCATTFRGLYVYFERRLSESNLQKERQGVDEVIRLLTELRDAWAIMLNKQASPSEPQSASALAFAAA